MPVDDLEVDSQGGVGREKWEGPSKKKNGRKRRKKKMMMKKDTIGDEFRTR